MTYMYVDSTNKDRLVFPEEYKYLEQLMTSRSMGQIAIFIKKNMYADRVSVSLEAVNIAGIYLLNNMHYEYETILGYAEKKNGKQHTTSGMFVFVIMNDLGVDEAEKLWKQRNTRTSIKFWQTLSKVKDEYLDMLLSTDKFYKNLEIDIPASHISKIILSNKKLFELGKKYPKFVSLGTKIYDKHGYEEFLPDDAQEIFLF